MTARPSEAAPDTVAAESESLSFEEALTRLEGIVRRLESGEVPLEESLRAFEEGVRLARLCSSRLDEAERKVSLLLADAEGVSEVDFETGEVIARARGASAAGPGAEGDGDYGDPEDDVP